MSSPQAAAKMGPPKWPVQKPWKTAKYFTNTSQSASEFQCFFLVKDQADGCYGYSTGQALITVKAGIW